MFQFSNIQAACRSAGDVDFLARRILLWAGLELAFVAIRNRVDGGICSRRALISQAMDLQWFCFRQRPYRIEYTGSLPNSAVKRYRARLVLGWGTAWEPLRVLLAFYFY